MKASELRRRAVEGMQAHEGFDILVEMPDGQVYETDSVYWSYNDEALIIKTRFGHGT